MNLKMSRDARLGGSKKFGLEGAQFISKICPETWGVKGKIRFRLEGSILSVVGTSASIYWAFKELAKLHLEASF